MFHRFYDALFASKDYAGELRRVLTLAGIDQPARVLEIGAGTGNHTLACAALGHTVTAVEIDPAMVALAEAKFAALPAERRRQITLFPERVEALDAGGYDLALAMFNVVNYIGQLAELESFIGAVAGRLRPGAPFIFDAWNGVAALRDPPRGKTTRVQTPTHELEATLTSRTDAMALRTELDYALEARTPDGRIERGSYRLVQTLWPPKVLLDIAATRGLELMGVHPLDDTGRPATERDWKILCHTRRA